MNIAGAINLHNTLITLGEGSIIVGVVLLVFLPVEGWLEKHNAPRWQGWLLCCVSGALLIGLIAVFQLPLNLSRIATYIIVGAVSGAITGLFVKIPSPRMRRSDARHHRSRLF